MTASITAPAAGAALPVDVIADGPSGANNNYPLNKLAFGSSGAATRVSATDPLPVAAASTGLTATSLGDGAAGTTAETITVAAGAQALDFYNLSDVVIWASWTGTAAANAAGSFPIPPLASGIAGYYAAPAGASGSLSIVAASGSGKAFTCIRWA